MRWPILLMVILLFGCVQEGTLSKNYDLRIADVSYDGEGLVMGQVLRVDLSINHSGEYVPSAYVLEAAVNRQRVAEGRFTLNDSPYLEVPLVHDGTVEVRISLRSADEVPESNSEGNVWVFNVSVAPLGHYINLSEDEDLVVHEDKPLYIPLPQEDFEVRSVGVYLRNNGILNDDANLTVSLLKDVNGTPGEEIANASIQLIKVHTDYRWLVMGFPDREDMKGGWIKVWVDDDKAFVSVPCQPEGEEVLWGKVSKNCTPYYFVSALPPRSAFTNLLNHS